MKKKHLTISIMLMLFFGLHAFANNLQITNVSLAGINTTDHFMMVKFDLSWENSWRTSSAPNNWDAAWIFVKYRANGGQWLHAALSTIDSDHTASTGSIIDPANDGTGVFMYRSENGTGSNAWTNIQLRWNYSNNGVPDNATSVEVQVIGIEMVYVPQGSFFAGDNALSTASFRQGSIDNDPWYIGSENAIDVVDAFGTGTGIGPTNLEYYYVSGARPNEDLTGTVFTIPEAFPKGYKAFYCMKYEITQGQYTEFLNMLIRAQQSARVQSDITSDAVTNNYVLTNTTSILFRNTIQCPTSGNGNLNPIVFSTTTPEIACNYLSWSDGTAYSDWAGLRPMSELEFEKACRGALNPISGEFAWGDATVAASLYTLNNSGLVNEGIASNYSTTSGNASFLTTNPNGPLRVGIFAANGLNSGRISSGAGYSGIMELSGNLWERPVTVGNSTGRNYTGVNGDGNLNSLGNSNVPFWPDNTTIGTGFRGGVFGYDTDRLAVSNRVSAAYPYTTREDYFGFRCVRCQ